MILCLTYHMYLLGSGHCFSEALESLQSPSLPTEASLNDVAGLKSGLSFLYLCQSSAGQRGKRQEPSALRKRGPCAFSAV